MKINKINIKKFILPVIQLRIDWEIKIYIMTSVVGAIIGLLIIFPLNQIVFFHENVQFETDGPSLIQQVNNAKNNMSNIYKYKILDAGSIEPKGWIREQMHRELIHGYIGHYDKVHQKRLN